MNTCPKCNSTVLIDGVRILDRREKFAQDDLTVAVYKDPDAFLFKGEVKSELTARVCGNCGYVEFFATNPAELLAAVAESTRR